MTLRRRRPAVLVGATLCVARWIRLLSLLLALFSTAGSMAAEFPRLEAPAGFGVLVHSVTTNDRELDMIAEAGFKIVRIDVLWDVTEPIKGFHDFGLYEAMAAKLHKRGIRMMLILGYANPLYGDPVPVTDPGGKVQFKPAAPTSPAQVAAFTAWATAAARRFSAYRPIFEIWNEPEWPMMWSPKADVNAYSKLALDTCRAIRKVTPGATIIGPATGRKPTPDKLDFPFLEEFASSPAMACFDAISVHPYLWIPELKRTPEMWNKVRGIISAKAPPRKPPALEVINSEWGLSTFSRQISEPRQAAYLVRMMLLNLYSKVPVSIWYDWKDDGIEPDNAEHHFGIINYEASPKPAWFAMKTMTRRLAGATIEAACLDEASQTTLLWTRARTGAGRVVVAWVESGKMAQVAVPAATGLREAHDMMDKPAVVAGQAEGRKVFALTEYPLYLSVELPSAIATEKLCDPATLQTAKEFRGLR